MIGFMMGTAIAFFVVMGDLAPPIVADFAGVESSERLRLVILAGKIHRMVFNTFLNNIVSTLGAYKIYRSWTICGAPFKSAAQYRQSGRGCHCFNIILPHRRHIHRDELVE